MSILLPASTFVTDFGPFVGYGNRCILPFADMVAQGLGLFVCESDLEAPERGYSTMTNLTAARAANVPLIGTYPWLDPGDSPGYALDRYTRAAEREQPDGIWIDMEQDRDANGNLYPSHQISDRLQSLLEGLRARLPHLVVDLYSRMDFIRLHCPDILTWYKPQMPWIAGWPDWGLATEYLTWAEIVAGSMRQCLDIAAPEPRPFARINVFDGAHGPDLSWAGNPPAWIWQATSRIRPRELAGTIYDHQYDFGWANLPLPQLKQALHKEKILTTPSSIYKTSVANIDKAWLVWTSGADKDVDVAALSAAADGLIFSMVSQVSAGMQVDKDTAFPIRAARASVPGIGVIGLDADLFGKKEIDLDKFRSSWRDMWNNETLRAILEQWRSNPIPETEWTAKKLNISAGDGGWIPLSALVLHMSTTTYSMHGSLINGMWQQALVDDLLKPLTTLMGGGYIPSVPIYLMANRKWYQTYAGDSGWTPSARLENKQLAGLGLMRVWHEEDPGLIAEAPMAAPAATLRELRQYVPAASYNYPLAIPGINFQFFVYSYDRLRAVDMFYPGKAVTPLTASIWCDTPVEMRKSLGAIPVVVTPPVEGPPATPTLTPEQRLDRLEAWAKKFPVFE